MSVAVLPYGKKPGLALSKLPLSELSWPLGGPDNLNGTIADLGPEDHLLVYPNSRWYYLPHPGIRCRVSLAIAEPEAVHGYHMKLMRLYHRRFHRVLTCNQALIEAIPNALHYVYGSTWVSTKNLDRTKSKQLSLIASAKRVYEGHRLRHATVDWVRENNIEADILGRGYKPFTMKSDGLAPYRYSIVIENVRERSFFTEKLIDCLLCDTVPIYWGAPDIGDYFDTSGMLICNDLDDIKAAVKGLSDSDFKSRGPAILKNRDTAAQYANPEVTAARLLLTGRMLAEEPS